MQDIFSEALAMGKASTETASATLFDPRTGLTLETVETPGVDLNSALAVVGAIVLTARAVGGIALSAKHSNKRIEIAGKKALTDKVNRGTVDAETAAMLWGKLVGVVIPTASEKTPEAKEEAPKPEAQPEAPPVKPLSKREKREAAAARKVATLNAATEAHAEETNGATVNAQ